MRTIAISAFLVVLVAVCLPAQSSDVIDRRIEELAERVIESFGRLESARYRNKVAIADFENASELARKKDLGHAFAVLLQKHLLTDPRGLVVVERQDLERVLREQEIAVSDLVDQNQVVRIGNLAAADLLILGSVVELGDQVQVSARLVETETGRILLSETTMVPIDELIDRARSLVQMRHSVLVSYSLVMLEDTPLSTAGIGYVYSFSRGLSLGFEIVYGTAHKKTPFTTNLLSETFDWESEVNHLGFAVLFGIEPVANDWVGLRLQAGPIISSYMDTTTLLQFTDAGTPYTPDPDVADTEETAVLLGLMASVGGEFRLSRNLGLFVGGQAQYFPPKDVKKDFYYLVPPASWNIVVLNQELTLSGLGLRAALTYSF